MLFILFILKKNSFSKVSDNSLLSNAFFKSETASFTENLVSNPNISLIFCELT